MDRGYFEVVMKEPFFRKMLSLPCAFGHRHMKKGQKFEKEATVQTDRASWPVVIRGYDRFKFRNGWGEFVRANELRVGDVCRFELIDEEEFIFKVCINPSLNEV
ncbi:B3 domain-containing protein REM19-like [Lycium ferocissimum]|uniref:B3 domain-containing protein REM19-like n=1 Tax=Lycium ferocissimum TaxID=112874 RepID=UPI00281523F4|nr:B3 domain-containing protein REM19-like [Lycium ferocissimum]XP_059302624.1 B3 domain-containing protein REM19-like [Lycium ferocissimum]